MKGLKAFFGSRKMKATLLGIVAVVCVEFFGLAPDHVATIQKVIATLIGLYIGGTALEDAAAKRAGNGGAPPEKGGDS